MVTMAVKLITLWLGLMKLPGKDYSKVDFSFASFGSTLNGHT